MPGSHTANHTDRTIRMAVMDRMLRGEKVVGTIGPLEVPSREAIVGALRTIAAAGVTTRVALAFNPDRRHWDVIEDGLDEWCEEIVVQLPAAAAGEVSRIAFDHAHLVDDRHPLRILLAGDYVIQINDHAIGDGGLFLDRLVHVLELAVDDATDLSSLTAASARRPVLAALRETFIAHPDTRRALLAERRADRQLAASASNTESAQSTVPWQPRPGYVFASSPVSSLKAVQGWIKATDRRISVSAAMVVLIRRGLEAAGLAVHPDTVVIYDARRYLPPDAAVVQGNLVAGLPVRVSDPDDALAVSDALQSQADSGRPLAALALGVARHAVVGGEFTLADTMTSTPAVHVAFNSMGIYRALHRLPWKAGPEERVCSFVVRPGGPEDLTLIMVIVSGVIHLTASFHESVFDRELVQSALDSLLADPLGLLQAHATQ